MVAWSPGARVGHKLNINVSLVVALEPEFRWSAAGQCDMHLGLESFDDAVRCDTKNQGA